MLALLGAASLLAACGPPSDDAARAAESALAGSEDTGPAALVLVAGATGRTGRRVVAQLLQRGYSVRAFVRDADSARARLGDDPQYVVGDVRQPEVLATAFKDVDAVISAIGASGRAQDPGNTPEAVDYNGVRSLVDGARSAGVSRFVLVSSMGVTMKDHPLNQMFDDVLKWKFRGEEYLRASGMPYTIIRPAGLTEDFAGTAGIRLSVEDGDGGYIPRADVATVCIEALQSDTALNKTFSIFSDPDQPRGDDWAARFATIPTDR